MQFCNLNSFQPQTLQRLRGISGPRHLCLVAQIYTITKLERGAPMPSVLSNLINSQIEPNTEHNFEHLFFCTHFMTVFAQGIITLLV